MFSRLIDRKSKPKNCTLVPFLHLTKYTKLTFSLFNIGSEMKRFLVSIAITALSSLAYANPPVAPFYTSVMNLAPEGKLGQILQQEKIETPIKGAQAWKIAYISSDISNRKTISTGLVVAPEGTPPPGGRPVISWAHGTTGSAQNCGPSQILNPAVPLNEYFLLNGNSWTDYGIPALEEFIQEGYVVVATDYQGLGGGGKHQYSVAGSNGRDAINAVRAAYDLKETGANKKMLIFGWSQGGGATLAAAGIAEYIKQTGTASDNLEALGFVALAPDYIASLASSRQLDQATADKFIAAGSTQFSHNVFDFTHSTMFFWGTQAAFPHLKLTDLFTEEGAKVIDTIYSNKCMHVASDTFSFLYGSNFNSLFKQTPTNTLAWANALLEGSVPLAKPAAPVMIYFGDKDTTMPPVMGKIYQDQMCKLGGNVGRMQLPGEQSHFTTPGVAQPFYLQWMKDRVAGKPLKNGCLDSKITTK
jgi:pimeloyl-ACP methyl ester carboxylesterase